MREGKGRTFIEQPAARAHLPKPCKTPLFEILVVVEAFRAKAATTVLSTANDTILYHNIFIMDDDTEVFEIVDEENRVIGRNLRGEVHRLGLLHRAVYCWVFNGMGEVLIQQRNPKKKIGGGLWDLSVAEHLRPGETFPDAVVRGLKEELGIEVGANGCANVTGPLGPVHRRELHHAGFHDVELVQSYRLDAWSGNVQFDDGEVIAVRWLAPEALEDEVTTHPERFTQWMREEALLLSWFKGS